MFHKPENTSQQKKHPDKTPTQQNQATPQTVPTQINGAADVLAMQHYLGNQYVQRMLVQREPDTATAGITLTGSVGHEGDNKPADVKAIQARLQELGYLTGDQVSAETPDDKAEKVLDKDIPLTIKAIKAFQHEVVSLRSPDGRVDKDGGTHGKLNHDQEAIANTDHRVASSITSIFEGGKPDSLNLYDNGIISYGKHQATLASGSLYSVLKLYCDKSKTDTAGSIEDYLDRVKKKDASLKHDSTFIDLLKKAADDPAMSVAQDEAFKTGYWDPATARAEKYNVETPLGKALFYDTQIQGGLGSILKKAVKKAGGRIGDEKKDGSKITEQEFLEAFVEARKDHLLAISKKNKEKADEFTKQAKEAETAAAALPDGAEKKKKLAEAAALREKASRQNANSKALKNSANKSRMPVWEELVNSKDLELTGGEDGFLEVRGRQIVGKREETTAPASGDKPKTEESGGGGGESEEGGGSWLDQGLDMLGGWYDSARETAGEVADGMSQMWDTATDYYFGSGENGQDGSAQQQQSPAPQTVPAEEKEASGQLTEQEVQDAIAYNKAQKYGVPFIKLIQRTVGADDDGVFGDETVKAVARWQAERSMEVDGKVGSNTSEAIKAAADESPEPAPQETPQPAGGSPETEESGGSGGYGLTDYLNSAWQGLSGLASAGMNWLSGGGGENEEQAEVEAKVGPVDVPGLLSEAEDNPKATMDKIRADYPTRWHDIFGQIIQAKKDADGETAALNLQSLMNPPDVSASDIEAAVEAYQSLDVELTLTDPAGGDASTTLQLNFNVRTPYDISSRRGASANTNVDSEYNNVRWAKGSSEETEDAAQAYLENDSQTETLSEVYFDAYQAAMEENGGDQEAAREAAKAAVAARAELLLSSAQIGVDCSGTVMHVTQEAMPDAFQWMLGRRRESTGKDDLSEDKLISNYANVKMMTSYSSGGAGGGEDDLSVRWDDLQTAVPGLFLQMGTGHIGGIISNETHPADELPADVSGSRDDILKELYPDEYESDDEAVKSALEDQTLRVVKYYHSIDARRSDDSTSRYTNSNLPGVHMAWAIFRHDADEITDDCYKIEPEGAAAGFTGLYVPRQRELAGESSESSE